VGVNNLEDYRIFKERHRVFPAIFGERNHQQILDIAAGVGCASNRIFQHYPGKLVASDITPTCLRILHGMGVPTLAFDIDDPNVSFPLPTASFDAVVSLVTLEHLLHFDHFLDEIYRLLEEGGYFYISTPNYAAPEYLFQPLILGKAYHDPFGMDSRYEFYAHVRYFTYKTLIEIVQAHGFVPESVYLALPGGSTRYQAMYTASKPKALAYRYAMWLRHKVFPARTASEPILCCQKRKFTGRERIRKIVL